MSTKFFTNSEENSLIKKFKGIHDNLNCTVHFDALVGYFRSLGYFKLCEFLEKIPII